jgi:hypothetical protein
MTIEDGDECLRRYRAEVQGEPPPSLDGTVLKAAKRRASEVRFRRQGLCVLAVAAIAMIPFLHGGRQPEHAPAVGHNDFGRVEGVTRPYLLSAGLEYEESNIKESEP